MENFHKHKFHKSHRNVPGKILTIFNFATGLPPITTPVTILYYSKWQCLSVLCNVEPMETQIKCVGTFVGEELSCQMVHTNTEDLFVAAVTKVRL